MNKIIDETRYKKYKYFKEIYGIDQKTLYNYGTEGLIDFIKKNNKRYYFVMDMKRYMKGEFTKVKDKRKENICYARIYKKEDIIFLKEQLNYFETNFPSHELIYDVYDKFTDSNLLKLINRIKLKLINEFVIYNDQIIDSDFYKVFLLLIESANVDLIIINKILSD